MSRKLRDTLSRLADNHRELVRHAPGLFRGGFDGAQSESLKFNGAEITSDKRNELLAKLAAGEHVELELELLAYEQQAGVSNRKFLRFRDGSLSKLGRSGVGTPFLRDHDQGNSLAVAGTIIGSETEKLGDGKYAIRQTVRLTADWAVKIALEGNLRAVSIGWNPTGPIVCSVHNAPVWSKQECNCWPGQRFSEQDGEGRTRRIVRKADGPIVAEFVYTDAELIETSMVPIGGVRTAHAEEVRASLFASLSAGNPELGSMLEAEFQTLSGHEPEELTGMDIELLKLLGLSETATATEARDAVDNLKKSSAADKATANIVQAELSKHQAEIDSLKADKLKRDEDAFIVDALGSGRIAKGDEEQWRALHSADAKRATELMAKRQHGSATPVGAAAQRSSDPDVVGQALEVQSAPVITGGGVPFSLYELGARSKTERQEIAAQLSAAVAAVERHANPAARAWAHRFGFEGRLGNMPATSLGASTIANSADLDASRVGFHAAFMQSMEQSAADPLELLYTTVPSTGNLETWNWMGDLPGMSEWTADRKMSGTEAFKLSIANRKWSNGLRVKNDDIKDDKLGLLPSQIAGLATKAQRHPLDLIAKNVLNGFDGLAYSDVGNGLGYDGSFFFADAHRGGNDNKMTSALDAAGLTAAELLLESMTTYDGADPLDVHGTHLIVGPKLRAAAEKLLTQERLANGEDNYHRGKYKLIVSNRIRGTQDDYWFLADLSQSIRPFIYQVREPISTSAIVGQEGNNSVPSFINDELWFGAQARYNVGYFEFRLIVGSQVA